MTPEREGRFSLWPSPRKRQRRTIRSFADAVVRRRAMQAKVEVEVGFVDRVRPGAKDGSEVAAGGHAETSSRRRSSFAACPIPTDWRSRGTSGSCGSRKAGATVCAAPP